MYVVFCKIDHCIHIHWCIPMGLGHSDPWVESHMWPQQTWVKGHLGVNDLWFNFFEKKGHCIHILWCLFMGLSHNDPWVESHDLNRLGVKGHLEVNDLKFMGLGHNDPWVDCTYHLNRYGIKSNITMIAKVSDRESRRNSLFENHLGFLKIWG